ncbi:hypothetical protein NDU88_000032 [Pleurodeles waltl]|uniref:Uncharacterized protein n=1 Tax=Pleurodeles waltl TaxID=8319 RepID=A0AAV7U2U9_PLEWA|nr:hypothetical protein NDU88_000032 [Pleurodeles waltl]
MASGITKKEFYDRFFDPRQYLEDYFVQQSEFFDDITEMFNGSLKIFSSGGHVEGSTLFHILVAPLIYYTIPICDDFTEIIFASPVDKSIEELEKWLKNKPDAIDFSDLQKQGNWYAGVEKLSIVRRKATQVVKCDVMRSNPLLSVTLPQADCLLLTYCLELITADKKAFCDALKNVSSLLKPGGQLIMVIALGCTYYMVGTVKCPHLFFDEEFVKCAVTEAGYLIVEHHICPRRLQKLYDVTDFTATCFLKACKEREVSSDT